MSRTLVNLDDDALAQAASVLGTSTKVDTVNKALRLVAESRTGQDVNRQFDELLDLLGVTLEETDVRREAWR